ncbi:transcriptional regulatory protein [Yersinia pestis Z176003]|nr:transcriptional regulatory protein [Yersinia pestis Z176003]
MEKQMIPQDNELLTEIAVSYYQDEMTQEEIAHKFGISRIKVGRLLKRAKTEGIVEINVRYHPVFSTRLEQQLIEHFGLKRALIALDYQDEDEQRRQVAALVSAYLATNLKDNTVLAVGQGRNVAAIADHVSVVPERHCKFICGIGGTHRPGDAINADHISRRLAKKFGGTSENPVRTRVCGKPGAKRSLYAKRYH